MPTFHNIQVIDWGSMIALLDLQYTSYESCNEMAVADVAEGIVMQTPPEITLQLTRLK